MMKVEKGEEEGKERSKGLDVEECGGVILVDMVEKTEEIRSEEEEVKEAMEER